MTCPVCHKRRVARQDTVCRACRRFIAEFVDTKRVRVCRMPSVADVWLVMHHLGVDQDTAIAALGGSL